MKFSTIEMAIQATKEGRPIIIMDDDSAEAKSHLIMAAEKINSKTLKVFEKYGHNTVHVTLDALFASIDIVLTT